MKYGFSQISLLFYFVVVHNGHCEYAINEVYVCPISSDSVNGFVKYRYNVLCQTSTTQCFLEHKFFEESYAPFVVILHNKRWKLVKNITEHFSKCNINSVNINVNSPAGDFRSICSIRQRTIIFDTINYRDLSQMPAVNSNECTLQTLAEDNQLMNKIISLCPNTVWIFGSSRCSNMTSFGVKLLAGNNENDFITDYDMSKIRLRGKHLRLGMILSDPYFVPAGNGSDSYGGILFNFLEKISTSLNFTYSICFPKDNMYGGLSNGSWTGLVGQLITNETDVAFADFTITYPRSQVIDFTSPYWFEPIGIMIQQPQMETSLWKMFSLFTFYVWLAILGSVIACTTFLYILHKFSAVPIRSPFNKLGECFWFALSCFANQGTEYDPETWSVQNFMILFWFYITALLAIYSGGLIAMLTSSRMSLPFQTFEELGEALQQGRFKVTVAKGIAFTTALLTGEGVYAPFKEWLNNNPNYIVSREETFKMLVEEKDLAVLDEITTMESIQRQYCQTNKLIILNQRFFPGFFAFGLQKNSTLYEIFSREIRAAVDEGFIQEWKINSTNTVNSFCGILQPDEVIKAKSNVLMLAEFTGPFLLLGIGVALGLGGIFIERCMWHKQTGQVKSRPHSTQATGKRNPRNNHWIRY